MNELFWICPAAFLVSALTFFSGFGLGTVLLPVFAVFLPPARAVAATAVVHLFNNLGKLALVGRHADRKAALRFGVPAVAAAVLGSFALVWISKLPAWARYELAGGEFVVTPVKVVIAALMIVFAVVELAGKDRFSFGKNLPLGGALSGFFGGLSGHQGALRSAFLLRMGLTKEAFIGTGVVISTGVDLVRLGVYASRALNDLARSDWLVIASAVVSALLGAVVGRRLLKRIEMRAVGTIVAVMLFVMALALGLGLI